MRPLCSIENVKQVLIPTGDEGNSLQLLPPGVGDLDRLVLVVLVLGPVAHVVRVPDEVLEVLVLEGVQDVEEVVARGQFVLGVLVGEVLHELLVLLHHRPELLHADLVVGRHLHSLDLTERHELLLIR